MGLMEMASGASLWRGYEYFLEKRIHNFKKINDVEFYCNITGENGKYSVHINTIHPRKSTCTCPHADGKRVICKHMIALFFHTHPEEAKKYKKEVDDYEKEEELREEERIKDIHDYVNSLSLEELRRELLDKLINDKFW